MMTNSHELKPGIYEHFKHKDRYKVLHVARNCENPKQLIVVYQALYNSPKFGPDVVWTRSIEDFCDTKEVNGVKVPRFKFIREN